MNKIVRSSRRLTTAFTRKWAGCLALCLTPAALAACTSGGAATSDVATTTQALDTASCGYTLSTDVGKANKNGFKVKLKIASADGSHLNTTGLTILIDSGAAQLTHVAHGSFTTSENGYLLSTIGGDDSGDTETDADVLSGKAYSFNLQFSGTYSKFVANVMSNSGVNCDQTAPSIKLTTSGDFFTSNGTLNLSADASDDISVSKVVFAQDGVVIGTAKTAPYTMSVPVTNAINGRHQYSATAYDLTGNQASESKRALVAIGNKFFGTATTIAADYRDIPAHFGQLTPGNAGKWGSVESVRGQMNWTDLDTAYQFAKANNVRFKFHTLVWGQQQPGWIASLSPEEQLAEIEQWMTAVAERYPDIDLIDVVNEPLHAPPAYAAALGGAGVTGWDWVIKSFEMARAHFPKAELLLNDYSILTMASSTSDYLKIVNLLKDRGLIDGIGEQGHFYERAPEVSVISSNLNSMTATGLPVYITELDLNFADDARQANRMKDLFSTFWSNPSVLGVTHWGHLQGNMWQSDAYLIRTDGSSRPALTWIECYKSGGTNCTVPAIVPQPRTGAASGITLEAEQYDSAHDLLPAGNVVAYANNGSWLSFDQVAFNDGWDTLSVTYANGGSNAINLSIHLDSLSNAPVATVPLAPTGGWGTTKTVSVPWAPFAAQKNVFVRFNGGGSNVDKLTFSAPTGTGKNLIADSDFELGTKSGFFTWGSGTIANTTARAASGTHALAHTGRTDNSPLAIGLTSSVAPGKTYKVSMYASISGAASAQAYVTTGLQCVGGSTTYGRLGDWGNVKTINDGQWLEIAGDLVVPDCQLANVQFWLEGPGAGVSTYLDHVSVRQVSTTNIVSNGTFESGTTGWFTYNGGTLSASTDRAHGGTKSLLVANRANNPPAAIDLTSSVKAGNSYPFSLWASLRAADGSSKAVNVTQATTCKAADGTSSTSYAWVAGATTLNGGANWAWTQFSGTISIPSTCNLTQLQMFVEGAAGADLFVDDVQILDNSGTSTNLITDGTFESGQGAWGGWGYGSLAVTSTSAHGGSKSLLGSSMTPNSAISRDIKSFVAPGKKFKATAWVSVGNIAAGSGSVKFQTIQSCNAVGSDSYPWLAGDTVTNGAWKQITGTVDLSACTSIEKLQLFVGADSGDLYIDDVSLTPLP
ncbi:MAG TPA: endo-1,4-beta-xylanase [Polyangiaceae bacterium]|nr:endo-1,4-beta-xylanase [Polyangiaceae bacterium]